ncbi:unnamed protein product, partial [Staurois parvus]
MILTLLTPAPAWARSLPPSPIYSQHTWLQQHHLHATDTYLSAVFLLRP